MDAIQIKRKAQELRLMVLESVKASGNGHVATSFSCAEILATLFQGGAIRVRPNEPEWAGRDRFFLSKGHAATILYCVLADMGFIDKVELERVGKANGRIGVHLQPDIPGVEATSGSLGHGLGLACGVALAAKLNRENHLAFVLTGDGELEEGSIWEAALFAGHNRLNNLVWLIDRNSMSCADFTENIVALEPLDQKIESFGFRVEICDGHDPASLLHTLADIRRRPQNKPLCIIANTIKGKGLQEVESALMCHHYMPAAGDVDAVIAELQTGLGKLDSESKKGGSDHAYYA